MTKKEFELPDRLELKQAIVGIADAVSVDSEYVGYANHASENYRRYSRLLNCASIKDWVSVIDHSNPVVRAYAVQGILTKDPQQAEVIYPLLWDNTSVQTIQGCTVGDQTIATLAAVLLTGQGDPGVVQRLAARAKEDPRVSLDARRILLNGNRT